MHNFPGKTTLENPLLDERRMTVADDGSYYYSRLLDFELDTGNSGMKPALLVELGMESRYER